MYILFIDCKSLYVYRSLSKQGHPPIMYHNLIVKTFFSACLAQPPLSGLLTHTQILFAQFFDSSHE